MVTLKKWGQIAGFMGLVQSIIWVAISFMFLIVHDLELNYEYSNHSFAITFYESFLKRDEEGPSTVSIFMIIYLLLSLFWFAGSIYLIKTVNLRTDEVINLANTKRYSHLVWSVITFFICILDVVFTVSITTGFIKLPSQKVVYDKKFSNEQLLGKPNCHKHLTTTPKFVPRSDLFWVSLVKREAPDYNQTEKNIPLNQQKSINNTSNLKETDNDISETKLSGYLKQFSNPNNTKDVSINESFISQTQFKKAPEPHYLNPKKYKPKHNDYVTFDFGEPTTTEKFDAKMSLTETSLEYHDVEEVDYEVDVAKNVPHEDHFDHSAEQKTHVLMETSTAKRLEGSIEVLGTTKVATDRFSEIKDWALNNPTTEPVYEDFATDEPESLNDFKFPKENEEKQIKSMDIPQGVLTTMRYENVVDDDPNKEAKDMFYLSYPFDKEETETDKSEEDENNYSDNSSERVSEGISTNKGIFDRFHEEIKKLGDDLNKIPPAVMSQMIHKENKESHESLFPYPEHWKTKGFEEKYNEIKSAIKLREGSDELEIDLEDLDNTSPGDSSVTSSVDNQKFFQQLPQSSNISQSTIVIRPEKMVRNVSIFAMLLIASRFGVLLLLNFLLTLVSFYLSIRYAQIYKEQKEQSNNSPRATRRQTSRPSLFNDFNESSTVSFSQRNINQADKKNQAPNNKNIAFVIPVTKE